MAMVTDAVSEQDAERLEKKLMPELEENISIQILVGAGSENTIFSLSDIVNNWLKDIQNGVRSTIKLILPIIISPAETVEEIGKAIRIAWNILAAV